RKENGSSNVRMAAGYQRTSRARLFSMISIDLSFCRVRGEEYYASRKLWIMRDCMNIGVPKETVPYEKRVALVPDAVKKLVAAGFGVTVEAGAGFGAGVTDEMYRAAGATLVDGAAQILGKSDTILKVQPPSLAEARAIKEGTILISFLQPARNRDILDALAAGRVTTLSMHRVPRITRAQSMDALSSQSNIAGYKAALMA